MYSYGCLARGEDVWPPLQSLTYTYLASPLLLPPIQAHNFCNRPAGLGACEWATPREYHCFHIAGAPLAAPPWWVFPTPAHTAALSSPFPAASVREPSQPTAPAADSWTPWPEGGSLQVQLRWGRVERAQGPPRLRLPDFVRRELRRAYGTYPRTDVRVTRRHGEFLLQAEPRVGEPEYRMERRVVRRPDSGNSGPAPKAEGRGRPKKKGLG
ncbi:uncharacterized protein C10orf95 homolog [Castor canadensis]|uniref:Uncharacterized protein C10orf95 homolog n=1 Tax=Castor canadensis TaxID=51338 RepID=A0AC58MYN5_CASCN